ncbi:MAG: arylsulfatase [Rhodopirellula sp. JB055]|uniref:sulfatase family protein n=1 Tax=Rhodopirellula sp. JB055 TaxID=3342846 RepID=UPI003709EE61
MHSNSSPTASSIPPRTRRHDAHRTLLAFFAIALVCTALPSPSLVAQPTPAAASSDARPNVIIVYTDDQGFGDVSSFNPDAKFATPNMDRLAKEGIAFTNAHSSDSVCTPSRYGLLTGRYSWRTTLKKGVMNAEGKCLIADDRMTLASFLRDQGYQTGMVGKWHLGMQFPGTPKNRDWSKPVLDMPLDKGFDHFFGIPASLNYGVLAWFDGRHAAVPPTSWTGKKPNKRHVDYRIQPPYLQTEGEARQRFKNTTIEVADDFIDNQCLTRFTDKAIEWITNVTSKSTNEASASDAPFFLYLPLTSPHYPVCPLPQFWGQGDCGGYGEFVIETDHHLGRLLAHLDATGLSDNTLVILTSDNGPEKSWKQRIKDFGHHSNGPYRGGKRDIYEGGHRVPMLARWPNGIEQPGRTSDALVGQVDLLATVADLLGQSVPDHAAEDSHSFASILRDPAYEHHRVPLINHGVRGEFAITAGHWKWIAPNRFKDRGELYDLASDPSETKDVSSDHPQIVRRLQAALTKIVLNGRSTPGDPQSNDTGYWDDLRWIDPSEYADSTP